MRTEFTCGCCRHETSHVSWSSGLLLLAAWMGCAWAPAARADYTVFVGGGSPDPRVFSLAITNRAANTGSCCGATPAAGTPAHVTFAGLVDFQSWLTFVQEKPNGAVVAHVLNFKDGLAIPNATNAVFGMARVTTNHAGYYSVVVSNAVSSLTSVPQAGPRFYRLRRSPQP